MPPLSLTFTEKLLAERIFAWYATPLQYTVNCAAPIPSVVPAIDCEDSHTVASFSLRTIEAADKLLPSIAINNKKTTLSNIFMLYVSLHINSHSPSTYYLETV